MALAWNQDRVGPFCRSAEDAALIFNVICQPDEFDLSVLDIPFNWDGAMDLRKLRIGYLEEELTASDRGSGTNGQQALEVLKSLGIEPEPFRLPDSLRKLHELTNTGFSLGSPYASEAGASFDDLVRFPDKWQQVKNTSRRTFVPPGRVASAVDYLQMQRLRYVIMKQFADAVARFDVYIANGIPRPGGVSYAYSSSASPSEVNDPGKLHFDIANLCAYPAVAAPNGFDPRGHPTSIIFMGRLFNEAAALAVAKAYQDATKWHLKHPPQFA
jgi:Asp-tRNA(Asn)/Glu-tRNA(Gln) amidotransferase A subunit family amidase